MKYLVQTTNSLSFCDSIDDVYQALQYRPIPYGSVFSADDYVPLHYIANMTQQCYYNSNSDENNKFSPLTLPSTINQPLSLINRVGIPVENQSIVAYANQGGWAVNALNGFSVAPTDAYLCCLLYSGDFVYPIARWFNLPHEQLVAQARWEYTLRFSRHFDCTKECLILPQAFIDSFIDDHFQQREQRRKANFSAEWKQFQDIRSEMGW